jgi:hypothetical protein
MGMENKWCVFNLSIHHLLSFSISLRGFQPSSGMIHFDLCMHLFFQTIDKAFLEKCIGHAFDAYDNFLKPGYELFNCTILFKLG